MHSKYRLVVYLKPEFKAAFGNQNTAFHSPIKHDHLAPAKLGEKMAERLKKHFGNAYQSMMLFNNQNSQDKTVYYKHT